MGCLGLKELRRTVALELWGNRYAVEALEEISRAYREMLVELVDHALRYKASYKESIYEGGTSRKDPFDHSKELSYAPAVIRVAMVSGGLRVRVIKIRLRLARLSNGWVLDRDMVGALNIGLKALSSDGSPMALGSTDPH